MKGFFFLKVWAKNMGVHYTRKMQLSRFHFQGLAHGKAGR